MKIGMKKGRPPIKVKRPLAYTLLNFIYKASLPLLCHILLVSQCYLSISLALYPLAQLLFRLFSSDDAVVAQGVQMMHYLVPVYMTYICIEIFSGALRGCGDVRVPTIITVFAVCIMRIVWLAVALPFKHELSVVEFSYPLTWITATVLFAIYYAKGGWMQRCIAAQNAKTQG